MVLIDVETGRQVDRWAVVLIDVETGRQVDRWALWFGFVVLLSEMKVARGQLTAVPYRWLAETHTQARTHARAHARREADCTHTYVHIYKY